MDSDQIAERVTDQFLAGLEDSDPDDEKVSKITVKNRRRPNYRDPRRKKRQVKRMRPKFKKKKKPETTKTVTRTRSRSRVSGSEPEVTKMRSLRARLIRLAHARPELRPDLLPLLRKSSWESGETGEGGFDPGHVQRPPEYADQPGEGSQVPPERDRDGQFLESED